MEDHQKAGQAELAEVENEVMDKIFAPRMQPAIRAYLTKLRTEASSRSSRIGSTPAPLPGKTPPGAMRRIKPETVKKAEVFEQDQAQAAFVTVPVPGTSTSGTSSSR